MIKMKISTSPIIAKTLSVTGFATSVLLGATPAHALDFNFQFRDIQSGTGGTNGLVTGTLSGLVEGSNSGTGITATVTSSPGGQGLGSGYVFNSAKNGGNAFTVTSGNITLANAAFTNSSSGNSLYVSSNYPTTWFPQLAGGTGFNYYDLSTGSTTAQFTAATPVPFELNSTVGIATLGFCFGAAKVRKNHVAKKRMVSVES
jgi:hypothetical protein